MNYQQAYNKIIDAYFKDEIKAFDESFCFCGTLCGNRSSWANSSFRRWLHEYSLGEYGKMEMALFSPFSEIKWLSNGNIDIESTDDIEERPDFEDKLFSGMCAALDVLKEIHRSRGEDVDSVPEFKKRKLVAG